MRHFTLVNNSGDSLDITTTEILFHDISGLGFDEDNDFRQIGDFWHLNRTGRQQSIISGSVIFNEGEEDPYSKYRRFVGFINAAPLTMLYNPLGSIQSKLIDPELEEDNCFRRMVRVSKLEKAEKNEYGVLDCSIEFACYAPWYTVFTGEFVQDTSGDGSTDAWIWGGTEVVDGETIIHPPLVFEPAEEQAASVTRAKFRWEPNLYYDKELSVDVTSCPIKLTIYGPLHNPSWVHSIVSGSTIETISSGRFNSSYDIDLAAGDRLIIDGTAGKYQIYQIGSTGTITDLYEKRDFGTECFIKFRNGTNRLTVTSDYGDVAPRLEIEGYSYYATV